MGTHQADYLSDPQGSPEARKVELLISVLLRSGVVLSILVVVAGLALSFAHHTDYFHSPTVLEQVTSTGRNFPHSITQTLAGVSQLSGEAVVVLGLLLLIATPVMRVAVSILAFLYERDLLFTAITSFVLAMLVLSFYLGRVEG